MAEAPRLTRSGQDQRNLQVIEQPYHLGWLANAVADTLGDEAKPKY